jgi:superfamily I DNA and/or RNA helicase/transcription elongation GreA/GreB family factor
MKLTDNLLSELQNRLKVGNRRGVHLNALPGRSRYKFDISRLSYINKDLPNEFISALLSENPLKFKVSWKNNVSDFNGLFEEDQINLVRIKKSFENLINQTDAIESEKGINTFGFGYPLLVRRDVSDNKLTVAPLLIWSLRIKRTSDFNTWIIQRNDDDPIYFNEILINHLQNDADVKLNQISSEMMDDGLIDLDELVDICQGVIEKTNTSPDPDLKSVLISNLTKIKRINEKAHYESLPLTVNNASIEYGGIFSIFEVQKQSIINDYEQLLLGDDDTLDLEDLNDNSFQSISSVETDPSQQGILNALGTKRNLLIQGPPGTGKSQSLTAVLVNSLENHKKVVVVCEKITALEVLQNALTEFGLQDMFVMINDAVKDRRKAVNHARQKLEDSINYYDTNSRHTLDSIISKAQGLIDSINSKHKKVNEKIIGNDVWTQVVGKFLKSHGEIDEASDSILEKILFEFNYDELSNYLEDIKKAETLYRSYEPYIEKSFINSLKYSNENPYAIEKDLIKDFKSYKEDLSLLTVKIQKLKDKYTQEKDVLDLKKSSAIWYKLAALFSKEKSQFIKDQNDVNYSTQKLFEKIKKDDWIEGFHNAKFGLKTQVQYLEISLDKFGEFTNNENDLFTKEYNWFYFLSTLDTTKKMAVIPKLIGKDNWEKAFLQAYLNRLLYKYSSNDLPTNDNEHIEYTQTLKGLKREQINYIKGYWKSRFIRDASRFDKSHLLKVRNLYNKRSSTKYKRHSLRQIVNYDINLFTSCFPIILTTPDACSTLFLNRRKFFDIVLFDEASQLRLEDNLPALLKGKQVIIAGDEHQMPPSNYFSKIFEGSIEDEDDLEEEEAAEVERDNFLLGCESLLEFGSELEFQKSYLDFHYRSRHPYLIDFSNHAFYNKRLKPLPNQFEYNPINYIQVDGTFSDHTNELEAEMVLSIIENNINPYTNGEYPSVGIATFNIAQRNLILSKIYERNKFSKYQNFNDKMIHLHENGFFVKNLENIQGDERDIIILSTTYGINKDGKFAQRFGPLNHVKGYKLLNVIITRAKYKVYVCSSIPQEVFLDYNQYLVTEGSNNRRGVFFAYLAYAKAVSDRNNKLMDKILDDLSANVKEEIKLGEALGDLESPFEEEVYQVLVNHFGENVIKPQVKYAGFRIDMVYDAEDPNIPKIAIECDGAAFHSSTEAYLNDVYRQKILENNGFVFHRIWSTNWWRSPQKEGKRLINFIEKTSKTTANNGLTKNISIKDAFTDIIVTKEESLVDLKKAYQTETQEFAEIDEMSVEEIIKDEIVQPVQTELFQDRVKLNSKVAIKYINIGKNLNIHLVDTNIKTFNINSDLQKICIKSPLGASIVGKCVGDTAQVGNLDNYVEILSIEN